MDTDLVWPMTKSPTLLHREDTAPVATVTVVTPVTRVEGALDVESSEVEGSSGRPEPVSLSPRLLLLLFVDDREGVDITDAKGVVATDTVEESRDEAVLTALLTASFNKLAAELRFALRSLPSDEAVENSWQKK